MRNYSHRLMKITMHSGLLTALLLTCSCGLSKGRGNSGDLTPAPITYVYVSAGDLAQLKVQSDGTLASLSPATITAPDPYGFGAVAVDPSSQYAFAGSAVYNSNVLSQFVIGSDGTLTSNSTATVNYGDGGNQFIFTPNGKFAIFPNFANSTTTTYSLNSSGALTFDEMVTSCPQGPASAAVDPSGQFAYVGCRVNGPPFIAEYRISATGTLTPLSPSSVAAAGVNDLQVAPNGFLYSVNGGEGTITAFWIDESTGQLANAGSFPTGTGTQSGPVWMAFDPTGAFAFVINFEDNSVTQFVVNTTTGALTMNGPDVPTGRYPIQVTVDASGKYLFVLNEGDGTISQFLIGSTGRLTSNGTFSLGAPYTGTSMALAAR